MYENKFAEYWAQAEYCYFKAGLVGYPASKQLWIQMAQDWIVLAENEVPQSAEHGYRQGNSNGRVIEFATAADAVPG